MGCFKNLPCLALFVCVKFSLKGDHRAQKEFVMRELPSDPASDYMSLSGDLLYPNYHNGN